jgi:hypothetical protein
MRAVSPVPFDGGRLPIGRFAQQKKETWDSDWGFQYLSEFLQLYTLKQAQWLRFISSLFHNSQPYLFIRGLFNDSSNNSPYEFTASNDGMIIELEKMWKGSVVANLSTTYAFACLKSCETSVRILGVPLEFRIGNLPNTSRTLYILSHLYGVVSQLSSVEICALLGYYAAPCGNCLPTFRDN